MTPAELIGHLETRGVVLEAREGKLRYSAPKGVLTPDLKQQLKDARDDVLAILAARPSTETCTPATVPSVSRDAEIPLSYAQERLWLAHQVDPASNAYNIVLSTWIEGALDVPLLERCIDAIVARHEIFRTTCATGTDQARQVIHGERRLELTLIEGNGDPVDARRLGVEFAGRPFDLGAEPALRCALVASGPQKHLLVVATHYIAVDGWSYSLFWRELSELYRAGVAGTDPDLPDLPLQYADLAAWERASVSDGSRGDELAFWEETLRDTAFDFALPGQPGSRASVGYGGTTTAFELPTELAQSVRALGRSEGVTLFMIYLAAFQALLHRYARHDDIVVGIPATNRNQRDLESVIGPFGNTVLLRLDCSGAPAFSELLQRVKTAAGRVYAHQTYPFERLVDELNDPVLHVLFSLHEHTAGNDLQLEGLQTRPEHLDLGTATLPLHLRLFAEGDAVSGSITYATDLLSPDDITRLLAHFENILACAAAGPATAVPALQLLSRGEREALQNKGPAKDAPTQTLHRLFEDQASLSGDAIAAESRDEALSYATLDGRANALGGVLIRLGAHRGSVICVDVEDAVYRCAAVLAALKTGSAFTGSRECADLLVTDAGDPASDGPALRIDQTWDSLSTATPAPGIETHCDDLACVILAAGDQRKPLTHRTLANVVASLPGSSARTAALSRPDSLFFVPELFGTWFGGGSVVGLASDDMSQPDKISSALREQQIERAFIPFRVLNRMAAADMAGETELPDACEIYVNGDDFRSTPATNSLLEKLPGWRITALHGIPDTHLVLAGPVDRTGARALGRPLPNTQAVVIEPSGEPMPANVCGELAMRGCDHEQEELTRTSAQCSLRDGGSVEYVGDASSFTMMRGRGLNLEEIETALLVSGRVVDAAVALEQ